LNNLLTRPYEYRFWKFNIRCESPVGSKKSCTSSYELRMVVVFEKKKARMVLELVSVHEIWKMHTQILKLATCVEVRKLWKCILDPQTWRMIYVQSSQKNLWVFLGTLNLDDILTKFLGTFDPYAPLPWSRKAYNTNSPFSNKTELTVAKHVITTMLTVDSILS